MSEINEVTNGCHVGVYERTDSPRDPLRIALVAIARVDRELANIRPGLLTSLDRAALDRAALNLRLALARVADVEAATRPPVVHRHPRSPWRRP